MKHSFTILRIKSLSTLLLIAVLSCFNSAYAAGPNLVANPSFEADDFTDAVAFPNGFTSSNGTFIGQTYNNNSITGWDITQNVDGWVDGGTSNWADAFDGNQYLDLIGNNNVTGGVSNSLSQVINTIPGITYTFSFHWGEDVGHSSTEIVRMMTSIIDANNTTIFNQALTKNGEGPINGRSGPNTWEFFETTFIATTTLTTIQFSATPPGNGDTAAGASLDLVSVTSNQAQAVPTLSEWSIILLMMLLGIVVSKPNLLIFADQSNKKE